jgi:alkylation response protein AidB-like acyl-CoA dehydrogenase
MKERDPDMVQTLERPTTHSESHKAAAFSPPGFPLQAKTEAGKRLVELAEKHAADFATRAAQHDRDGSYPFENIEALKESGFFTAPVPDELGGMGVDSWHDLLVASSRLAQGDPSVAIGVNMHLVGMGHVSRRYRDLKARDDPRAAMFGMGLMAVVQGKQVIAAAVSEPAQDLTRPNTTAARTEDGWVINGTKIFGTMSPASSALFVAVTIVGEDEEKYAFALVPTNTPGVTLNDDWDALGMRASGSGSITLADVHVPKTAIFGTWPAGHVSPELIENFLPSGLFHASASLGIAEAAHALVVEALARKRKGDHVSPHMLMTASQNAIDLFAIRSAFERAANLIDHFYGATSVDDWTLDFVSGYFAEVQAAKTFINEVAQRIVDRALALSGGAGYMAGHPLARAYRDVRAGAFMHPLGANRAYEFIGQVALGVTPTLS